MAVALGETHCLALKEDGAVVGWGSDMYKQATPPDGGRLNAVAVAAGAYHSLALLWNGTIVTWGNDTDAGLGSLQVGVRLRAWCW